MVEAVKNQKSISRKDHTWNFLREFDAMKTKGLGLLSLAVICALNVGCIVKHSTQGFQTNPPARMSEGFPHGFQPEQEKSGISKFFAQLNPGKLQGNGQANQFKSDEIPPERDATSLQSHATISPELLIVAGEMALNNPSGQPNYEAAAQYFNRAIKLDPKNLRANLGLAQAEKGRGRHKKADRIYQALREWYPEQAQQFNQAMPKGFGSTQSKPKSRGIQQVSYVEPLDPAADLATQPEDRTADRVISRAIAARKPTVMQPEIRFSQLNLDQRIANPYFQGRTGAASMVSHQSETSADRKSAKKRRSVVVPAALVIDNAKQIDAEPTKHYLTDAE